jgi:hypothetical protein
MQPVPDYDDDSDVDGPWPQQPAYDDPPLDCAPFDPMADLLARDRVRNVADGQIAMDILDLLAAVDPRELLTPATLVAAEIGPALGIGSGAATKLVDVTVALNTRLRATFRAVCAGALSWYKASILAEATAALTDDQARLVEAAVLARAAGQTPARFADAVRRAVARIDPDGADARRRQAKQDVKLIRAHHGDGMGDLFARMASEQLDTVWTAADLWARSRKADGDKRNLDQLRVAALVQWAQSYLHHGDPAYCDQWCTPGSHARPVDNDTDGPDDDDDGGPDDGGPDDGGPDDSGPDDDGGAGDDGGEPPVSTPPTRHGRPGVVQAIWDLPSLLGLAARCGELSDSGAVLPPQAMRDLLDGGVALRRMIIDPDNGELLDLTPRSWPLPRTRATDLNAPVVIGLIIDQPAWQAIRDGSADPDLHQTLANAPQAIRDLLAHPCTADDLDQAPTAYPAPMRLAEFIAVRDRHPVNPTAGPTAAAAADLDHTPAVRDGGQTIRDHLAAVVRHWHRLKTHGGWTAQRTGRGWTWTSPRGHTYQTQPYDYRLGP